MNKQDSGIDQLIHKVRSEAIDKAESEREQIIKKAEAEAKAILLAAQAKGHELLEETRAFVAKEKRKLAAELELSARDFSLRLAERLREQMFFPAIKESVRITLKEPEFLKQVLQRLISDFVSHNPGNLDVLVPKELRTTLAAYFAATIFDALDRKCDIRLVDEEGIEGFALLKRGEHYVWDFRVDTIAEELLRLVEPSLRKYFTNPNRAVSADHAKAAVV